MPLQSYASHIQEIEAFGLGYSNRGQERDRAVLRSWRRCIDSHRLDPAHTSEAHIVTDGQLRAHREESEPLIHIARHALERLYQQLKGLDYVLLLAGPDRGGRGLPPVGPARPCRCPSVPFASAAPLRPCLRARIGCYFTDRL